MYVQLAHCMLGLNSPYVVVLIGGGKSITGTGIKKQYMNNNNSNYNSFYYMSNVNTQSLLVDS